MRELAGTGPTGFRMGDQNGRADEQPVHRVTLDPFSVAIWPVTNREYAVFLELTGNEVPSDWGQPPFDHPDAPVCAVSWYDAVAYADWLTRHSGRCYHLPSEAQREYAARGGSEQHAYPWGHEPLALEGPYQRGLSGTMVGGPRPITRSQGAAARPILGPNGFGLYHMADNVHEWCADYYDRHYYCLSPVHNPPGPGRTDRRVARGGSWRHDIKYCRCAARSSLGPDKRFADFGFRLASGAAFEYT